MLQRKIISNNLQIVLDDIVIHKVKKSRLFLVNKISKTNDLIYGVNTGFGDLHNIKIEKSASENDEIDGIEVKSPIVGTAYLAPEPNAKTFVKVIISRFS